MINWILTKCMGLGKKMSFSWKLLKWIYSVLEKSSSLIDAFSMQYKDFKISSLDFACVKHQSNTIYWGLCLKQETNAALRVRKVHFNLRYICSNVLHQTKHLAVNTQSPRWINTWRRQNWDSKKEHVMMTETEETLHKNPKCWVFFSFHKTAEIKRIMK